jgi:TPR repeat protein
MLLALLACAPLQARAQDAPAVPAAAGEAPDVSEYDAVPEGLLIAPDADSKKTDEKAQQEAPTAAQPLGQLPGIYEIPGAKQAEDNQAALSMDQILLAYSKGDYPTALRNLEPMAANRQHPAEDLLGVMYLNGQGVTKDAAKALDLLGRASESGLPLAEHYLGVMYFTGQGMEQPDPIKALMWLEISIIHYQDGADKDRAKADRDAVFAKTTRLERSRASEMARDWLEAHGEAHLMDMQH